MARLGVPQEYNAVICDAMTEEPLVYLPWSSINWQRVRNRLSIASVFVADSDGGIECCGSMGGLRPWNQMLRIERDGEFVWDGPLTSWGRSSITHRGTTKHGYTLGAHDRFALASRRLVGGDITATVSTSTGALFRQLLVDGALGTVNDPYQFNVPALAEFLNTQEVNAATGVPGQFAGISVDREYRIARMERVMDCISELADLGVITFTQQVGRLWVNEVTLREHLGPRGLRPVLGEATTIGIPGVQVDGLGVTTVAYAGSQGQGKYGFPTITTCDIFQGVYVQGTLELGVAVLRGSWESGGVSYSAPIDVASAVVAARAATPTLTIEQTALAPAFNADIADLVPGVVMDLAYSETCAFGVPFVGITPEFRYWYTRDIGGMIFIDLSSYLLTPTYTPEIRAARLEQLDVNVVVDDDGAWSEQVMASLTPYADWDGTVPANWPIDFPPHINRFIP